MDEVGAKIGQVGAKIGQTGAKIGHVGTKIGHVGTKSGQTGAKMGQVGAQIDQDDPKIGQDGPKIGQDGANFEDLFEFLIFCKIFTNIEKKHVFSKRFATFLRFAYTRSQLFAVRRRKRVVRVLW